MTFGGVEYVGPVVLAAGNVNAAAAGQIAVGAADIEVFDVTHDPARVRLIRSNLILAQVNVAAGEVSLIQTIIVSNEGPQTYVAQPVTASPVRIAPPVGAVGVSPLAGVRREDMVVTGDGGLVPATPFPPGETPLTMGYTLAYAGPWLAVTIPVLQPIGQFRVLVPARGVQVESDDLRPFGVTALGGNSFTAVGATDLLPGTPVRLHVAGTAARRAAGALGRPTTAASGRCGGRSGRPGDAWRARLGRPPRPARPGPGAGAGRGRAPVSRHSGTGRQRRPGRAASAPRPQGPAPRTGPGHLHVGPTGAPT